MSENPSRTAEDKDQPQDATFSADRQDDNVAERGADSPATKAQKSGDEFTRERDEAKEEIKQLEENPPERLEDWPEGKAKYETFGGPEGEHSYQEGPERKLGDPDVRHREDGSVEVRGEEAEDPEEYKTEPIPGGPTDPNTPNLRMDKASPDDVSDVAKQAAEGDGSEESSES